MRVCNAAHYTPFTMFYEIRFISSLSMHCALFLNQLIINYCEMNSQYHDQRSKSLSKEQKKLSQNHVEI